MVNLIHSLIRPSSFHSQSPPYGLPGPEHTEVAAQVKTQSKALSRQVIRTRSCIVIGNYPHKQLSTFLRTGIPRWHALNISALLGQTVGCQDLS